MTGDEKHLRYQDLQRYVGWTEQDAARVHSVAGLLDEHLVPLVDDFYAEIEHHPAAARVITGGPAQVLRLKGTLVAWLRELLRGPYDQAYVARRWNVGWRHVEIGLDQVYTNVALSRLRAGLLLTLNRLWAGGEDTLRAVRQSLNTLLDLDLAIIEDAYQAEYLARQQRLERLATIGQLGGGIAHELRNPLNVIKTSIYYLLHARNPAPEKQAEHLHRIERQVGVADAVVSALSNYARMPSPELLPVPVRSCIDEVLADVSLPADATVSNTLPDDLPDMLGDRGQLKIVFSNLVRNALEAMPKGGELRISATAAGGGLEVAVADTGPGIAADVLVRIMEPLFTTKAKGLGLGLALCRSIVEKHQGTLKASSVPGEGATFTVTLRAAPRET
jgi:signal transduction histidine kinase